MKLARSAILTFLTAAIGLGAYTQPGDILSALSPRHKIFVADIGIFVLLAAAAIGVAAVYIVSTGRRLPVRVLPEATAEPSDRRNHTSMADAVAQRLDGGFREAIAPLGEKLDNLRTDMQGVDRRVQNLQEQITDDRREIGVVRRRLETHLNGEEI